MIDSDDIEQQLKLLAAHRRTLAHLLTQEAQFSAGHIPAHVANGIADARAAIAHIKVALRAGGTTIGDMPDDYLPPSQKAQQASSVPFHLGDIVGGDKVQGDKVFGDKITIEIGLGNTTSQGPNAELIAAARSRRATLPVNILPKPAPLPPNSRMLFSRNPLFAGRENELKLLAQEFQSNGATTIGQAVAVTGMAGIGKTNLATEFVHRYGQFYTGGVFWVNFSEPNSIATEIALCGGFGGMNLSSFDDPKNMKPDAVMQIWQDGLPRLLIFDNCEDEVLLGTWRPPSGSCDILITSRGSDWDIALGVKTISLNILSLSESIALLQKFRSDLDADDVDLLSIIEELGNLPLALHLAGSYLKQFSTVLTPAMYLAELRTMPVLEHESLQGIDSSYSPTGHLLHVGRTLKLSYDRLRTDNIKDSLGRALLSRAVWFAPGEAIPSALLLVTLEPLNNLAHREGIRALRRLIALGLVERDSEDTVKIHRLSAEFVLSLESDNRHYQGSDTVVSAIW